MLYAEAPKYVAAEMVPLPRRSILCRRGDQNAANAFKLVCQRVQNISQRRPEIPRRRSNATETTRCRLVDVSALMSLFSPSFCARRKRKYAFNIPESLFSANPSRTPSRTHRSTRTPVLEPLCYTNRNLQHATQLESRNSALRRVT